jgi:hypothetical protein
MFYYLTQQHFYKKQDTTWTTVCGCVCTLKFKKQGCRSQKQFSWRNSPVNVILLAVRCLCCPQTTACVMHMSNKMSTQQHHAYNIQQRLGVVFPPKNVVILLLNDPYLIRIMVLQLGSISLSINMLTEYWNVYVYPAVVRNHLEIFSKHLVRSSRHRYIFFAVLCGEDFWEKHSELMRFILLWRTFSTSFAGVFRHMKCFHCTLDAFTGLVHLMLTQNVTLFLRKTRSEQFGH